MQGFPDNIIKTMEELVVEAKAHRGTDQHTAIYRGFLPKEPTTEDMLLDALEAQELTSDMYTYGVTRRGNKDLVSLTIGE